MLINYIIFYTKFIYFFYFLSPNFFCRILILLFYLIVRKEQINIMDLKQFVIIYISYIYIILYHIIYMHTAILLYYDILI